MPALTDDRERRASRIRTWQPTLQWGWTIHFALCTLVILYGIHYNGGKQKYYPVVQGGLPDCQKAFMNVLAYSTDEEYSIVCCDGDDHSTASICGSKPKFFLSSSLARFPGAWILPLLPMTIRLGYTLIARLFGQKDGEKLSTTTLRLLFYIATLNFRGWILYVLLGYLESLMVMPVGEDCWFRELMPRPSCHARMFDFSDHTVLYMAQILPLPLAETLHSLALPFWKSARWPYVLLSCGLAYLYIITLMGQFKTAAYFHTGGEIIAGYIISMIVQLPYATLQCFPVWEGMRLWLFEYPFVRSRED